MVFETTVALFGRAVEIPPWVIVTVEVTILGGVETVETWACPAMEFVTVVTPPGWVSSIMIMFTDEELLCPEAPVYG